MPPVLVLVAATVVAVAVAAVTIVTGIHQTPEGHVTLTYIGGSLSRAPTPPGYHWHPPAISTVVHIPVRVQTSVVHGVECGTSSGVVMYFDSVEVVHLLHSTAVVDVIAEYSPEYDKVWVNDRLFWEVSQICSRHTLQEVYIEKFDQIDEMVQAAMDQGTPEGFQIIAVRVTKPRIPEIVRQNYEKVESLKAELLVLKQHELNVLRIEETERRRAVIEAQKEWQVSNITMQRRRDAAESQQTIANIENGMITARGQQHADAAYYQQIKRAEANKRRLTPRYLQLLWSRAMLSNTKLYLGPAVPGAVVEEPESPGRLPAPDDLKRNTLLQQVAGTKA